MKPTSILRASDLYAKASQCRIIRDWVDHVGLAKFSHLLRELIRSLGDEIADDFWQQTLNPIRRTAFALCSSPLPFAKVASAIGIGWDKLDRLVRQSRQLYPDSFELLEQAVAELSKLLEETSSPLISPLEALHKQHGALEVVLCNPRLNRAVANFFACSGTLQRVEVVSVSQLRGPHLSNALVTIGPCGWFPEYVFTAPRATSIHVISFRWIGDNWKPGPLFLNKTLDMPDVNRTHMIGKMPQISAVKSGDHSIPKNFDPLDLLPPMPVLTTYGYPNSSSSSRETDEMVAARLCHLNGNRAVFIAIDDSASLLIINLFGKGHAVQRIPADQLERGLYLLLRTSGGGDYIAPLANQILGDTAGALQMRQAEWKEYLYRSAVRRFGPLSRRQLSALVCSDLKSQGLTVTRPVNVHYWMSSKCIRPRKHRDFTAIMKFAGLGDKTEQLWSAMGEIDRAHKRAGLLIRQLLLQKIGDSTLDSLERDGEMEFHFGDQNGGSLTAYEITDVLLKEYEIPACRIGVLMDLEEQFWPA